MYYLISRFKGYLFYSTAAAKRIFNRVLYFLMRIHVANNQITTFSELFQNK